MVGVADLAEVMRRAVRVVASRWYLVLAWILAGETAAAAMLALAVWVRDRNPLGATASLVVMVICAAPGTLLRLLSVVAAMLSVYDRMSTLPRLASFRRVT